jgi:D-lactate dehydrogenase (cytochrome)
MMHEIISQPLPQVDVASVRCIQGKEEIAANHAPYLSDESKMAGEGADYLFFPNNEAELSAAMGEMARLGVKVTISAARTGLVGGAVPFGGAVISLDRFDKTLGIRRDGDEWRILAESSVTLRDLGDRLKKKNFPGMENSPEIQSALEAFRNDPNTYFYPPDPTEMSASLGGTVATNASGAGSYQYGDTRNWVRRLRVMLANGEILDIPRGKYFASPDGEMVFIDSAGNRSTLQVPSYKWPETKSTAGIFAKPGMDLIDLFIGSEGLFGVITQIEVALAVWHGTISVVQFLPSNDAAVDFVIALREERVIRPEFLEFYDGNALTLLRNKQIENPKFIDMPTIPESAGAAVFFDIAFDPDNPGEAFVKLRQITEGCGASQTDSWAGYERRELARFRHFRHALPETVNAIIGERKKTYPGLHKLGTDLAVPNESLREIWDTYCTRLDGAGLQWVAFGHIGDNHFHVNILPKDMDDLKLGLSIYSEFARKAVDLGGTVSAEHGVGKMKKKFLSIMYSPEQLAEMNALKLALDPRAMINPGNILDL